MQVTPTEILGLPIATFNVLLGAAIALVPVTINMAYDSFQRRRERRTVVKREVFLKALEGAAMMGEFIASSISGDVTWVDMVKVAPGWAHKLHLVAGDEAIGAFADLSDMSMRAVAEITKIQVEISKNKTEFEFTAKWRDGMVELQKRMSEAPPDPEARKELLTEFINKTQEGFSKLQALAHQRSELLNRLARAVYDVHSKYDELLMKAVVELRRELGFGRGSERYQAILKKSSERSRAIFEESLNAIDAVYEEPSE